MTSIETVPGWAFSWCWYFFIASAISGFTAVLTLILLVIAYSELSKKGALPLVGVYVAALLAQSITSIVTFWMCRSALNPKRK
jgi:membrane protein DedA with SNARE-associated domain